MLHPDTIFQIGNRWNSNAI